MLKLGNPPTYGVGEGAMPSLSTKIVRAIVLTTTQLVKVSQQPLGSRH